MAGTGWGVAASAILDVDGTLVDSNYQHALAWYRAFRSVDVTVPIWRIHRHIGIGGDRLVAAVTDDRVEERLGDRIRAAESRRFDELIGEVRPFEGARELIADLRGQGRRVVLASSGDEDDVTTLVKLLDAEAEIDAYTTSADVDSSKPAPDLIEVAMRRAGGGSGLMFGDSTWDVAAAERAGIRCVAVLTGGFSEAELTEAGAACVFESLAELRSRLDALPWPD